LSNQKQHSSGEAGSQHSERVQGHWTDDEHTRFIAAVLEFGKDWTKIEQAIGGTRTSA